ncbi:MAG: Bug family tripartite tricarboxylate transporter substrate binding protein [Pseudomonadota bacterium]
MRATTLLAGAAVAAAAFGLEPAPVQAQDFPGKPIRLIIPYPPGGASSLNGGVLATAAEPYFGQPMIPTIRAGGGGIAGAAFVLGEPADGHTVFLGDVTINSLRPLVEDGITYEPDDFTPIARITLDPMVFVASPSAPFSTMGEMVAYAEANPDQLVYSSDNVNGWTYVAFKALEAATGIEMRGIEFGGGGPAVANILGGNTMAYAGAPAVVGEHVQSGALIPLCAAGTERVSTLPDVPTCQEEGFDVVWQVWLGALVHADTPEDRVTFLRDAFAELIEDEGLGLLMARINTNVRFLGGEEWAGELEAEQARLLEIYELTR